MADTTVVLLVLSALIATAFAAPTPEANDCVCQTNLTSDEVEELFQFLDTEQSNEEYPIAPGEISPLVCGNCIEHVRRKRKISPEEVEVDVPEDVTESEVKQVTGNEVEPVAGNEVEPVAVNAVEPVTIDEVEPVAGNEVKPVEIEDFSVEEEPQNFGLKCPKGEKRLSNWCVPVDDY